MKTARSILCVILVVCMTAILASCAGNGNTPEKPDGRPTDHFFPPVPSGSGAAHQGEKSEEKTEEPFVSSLPDEALRLYEKVKASSSAQKGTCNYDKYKGTKLVSYGLDVDLGEIGWRYLDGVLVFEGSDFLYGWDEQAAEFASLDLADIETLIVYDGITGISGSGKLSGYLGASKDLKLKAVYLASTVESVWYDTFSSCKSLEKVFFPSVVRIGDRDFRGCENLKDVELPAKLEYLGMEAFSGCSSLTDIVIPGTLRTMKEQAFRNCGSLENLTILDGVPEIAVTAFRDCVSLKEADIPGSVKIIFRDAFTGCKSLEKVTLREGTERIAESAFSSCSRLSSLTLPEGLKTIEGDAFYRCYALESVAIPGSVSVLKGFSQCEGLREVTIADGVRELGNSAFSGCKSLESVVLPDSVETVGKNAFKDCSALAQITYKGTTYTQSDMRAFNSLFPASVWDK